MSPLSDPRLDRLRSLRKDYRAAFREWMSAVKRIPIRSGSQQSTQEVEAGSRARAAGDAYADARDKLAAEMLDRNK